MTADDTVSDYEKGPLVADYEKGDDTVRQPSAKFRPDLAKDTVTATLAEWEALTEGAGKTPWRPSHEDPSPHRPPDTYDVWDSEGQEVAYNLTHADSVFIAASTIAMPALLAFVREVQHILATQRHEVIGARGLREQDVVRARDIEQAARKWIGGEGS